MTSARIVMLLWCLFIFFIARPIVKSIIGAIKEEMKKGKTLRQVFREMPAPTPSPWDQAAHMEMFSSSSSNSMPATSHSSVRSWYNDPSYSSTPGNAYYRP